MNINMLSIVMPVFNGEAFIKASLLSLLNIIPRDVEIIVVDDGSSDDTVKIIENCFKEYIASGALKLFQQINLGVSAARNFGIDRATGKYIGFVDADDVVLPTYFEVVFKGINSEADIIDFGFLKFFESVDENSGSAGCYPNPCFGLMKTSKIIDKIFAISLWYPCTRVFKAELFENVRFPVGVRFCEDLMTIPYLYEKANSVVSFDAAIYGYRINSSGATLNVRPDYIENLSRFFKSIPVSGAKRHDYLRMATAYAIFSCNEKVADRGLSLIPEDIYSNIKKLKFSFSIYKDVSFRWVLILLYPRVFLLLRYFNKSVRHFA